MTMKVFDLSCDADHGFEGWFASAEAFDQQSRRRHIACPLCGSTQVRKLLSAPRLNLGAAAPVDDPERTGAAARRGDGQSRSAGALASAGRRRSRNEPGSPQDPPAPTPAAPIDPVQFQQMFLAMARRLIESTEDVGDRFAEEARKIHYQEAPSRAIRGAATRDEAAELRDEGIEVFALPLPESLKGPLQ